MFDLYNFNGSWVGFVFLRVIWTPTTEGISGFEILA
jgi:hypothetical protein